MDHSRITLEELAAATDEPRSILKEAKPAQENKPHE